MRVYIDTNIIIKESFLKSPQMQAFLKACRLFDIRVVIPQIVIDEAKGNFPKKLSAKLEVYQKAESDLIKIIGGHENEVSISEEIEAFNDWLDDQITEHEIEIIDYPNISLSELVEASYAQKKPFKSNGEGYKDFIVWNSIVDHLNGLEESGEIFLLNNNVSDFCEEMEKGKHVLHSNLVAQISEGRSIPLIRKSVKEIFDEKIATQLEGVSLTDIPAISTEEIREYACEKTIEGLTGSQIYALEGVPFGNELTINHVDEVTFEKEITLKKLEDQIIISIYGQVDIEVDGFIEKYNYYDLTAREEYPIYVHDGNWNDSMMWVGMNIESPVELTLFYSQSMEALVGHKVTLLEEIEDDWPYK